MAEHSGGSSFSKRKLALADAEHEEPAKRTQKYLNTKRGLFRDYTPIYSEELNEYPILLSLLSREKLDLLKVNKILKNVPGISYIKQIGLYYAKIFFKERSNANNFLLNNNLLIANEWTAKIPYNNIETQGIIRVPVDLSEEELLENLKTSVDILGVKRFMKKQPDGSFLPLRTVLVTFLSSSRPDHVTYEHMWFDVSEYIRPLLQCFTCYKFNHSSGSCKVNQVCSICAGSHNFKACTDQDNIKCVNCKGPHTAVAFACPVKAAKVAEIKNKISGKITYASVASKSNNPLPSLPRPHPLPTSSAPIKAPMNPHKRSLIVEIINSDLVLTSITKTITDILLKREELGAINCNLIKEILITNFSKNSNG